jgi:hypothetical protein
VEAGEDEPRGISGLAYMADQFLKTHLGSPYRIILSIGLVVGLSQSVASLQKAFASTTDLVLLAGSVVFQVLLLINQLAQVHTWRKEARERRRARKAKS